ncbi:MAG: HAD-IIIC family phosphatase [Actinoallomurus sp.]
MDSLEGDIVQVTLAASFTAEPVEPVIEFWSARLGLPISVSFAGYDQVFQGLLDSDGPLARNAHGLNVVLVRWTDLLRARDSAAPDADRPREVAAELAGAVRDAAARWAVPLLVVVCPDGGGGSAVDEGFASEVRATAGVHVLTPSDLEEWYPGDLTADAYADRLGHVPYTPTGFAAIGTAIMRRLYRILAPEPKVIVVDADNTLWDGVAGEGEVSDLGIDPARQRLQELLAEQRRAGRLLCLCSKNSPADTMAVIDGHPGMRLSADDFAATRINWRPKPDNLRELADELNLGLDSFVFVDDSPVECAEVRARCPQVAVLELPPDAADAERSLRHSWILDIGATTAEDARRAVFYRTEAEREQVRRTAPSLQGFLDSLDLRVRVDRAGPADVARVAQLTQRTNQFNLTGLRRTEPEVRDLLGTRDCLIVTAEDRFGSYGQVGVVIAETSGAALRLETFLLSCRALGRGVEHRMLAHLGTLAASRGLGTVELVYRATPRNRPAADFVAEVRGLGPGGVPDEGVFPLPASVAAAITYAPDEPPAGPATPGGRPAGPAVPEPASGEPAPDLGETLWALAGRAAPDLTTAELVEERMRADRAYPAGPDAGDPGSVDATVAALMAEALGVASVDHDENFFELGGTSLQLIGFMTGIRDRFGIELPTDTMYNSELTVRGVGASILLHGMAGPGDITDVLALVESMTDEQVEAVLGSLDRGSL